MIDSDEEGQKKLSRILKSIDGIEWTPWEEEFLATLIYQGVYSKLTSRQKKIVGRLYDKVLEEI